MSAATKRINPRKKVKGSKVRRPVRLSPSKKALLALVVLGCVATVGHYAWQYRSPIMAAAEEFIAQTVNAEVEHMLVEGVQYASPEKLREAIGMGRGDSLVGFDAAAARFRLEELDWVRLASVNRKLPDTIKIEIFEYKPVARLIDGNEAWVIDNNGRQISPIDERFDHLPVLSGEGVAQEAGNFFALLSQHPSLLKEISQAKLVGGRRWDLEFDVGVSVQLPEEKPAQALLLLLRLHDQREVLNMKGGTIDLRLEDRITIRDPESARVRNKRLI